MTTNEIELTPASLETFMEYAWDAGNWGYLPWVSQGNVTCTKAMRGNLSDLVKKGLIVIHGEGTREAYIKFTPAGVAFAAANGCDDLVND
jgi:hypothetical protein